MWRSIVSLIVCLACSSCLQPVRHRIFNDLPDNAYHAKDKGVTSNTPLKVRFSDTLYLPVHSGTSASFAAMLSQAAKLADEGKTDEALNICKQLSETLDDSDSLRFESDFASAEILLASGRYQDASTAFQRMNESKAAPRVIKEKSLLRYGQALCALNRNGEASKVFEAFQEQYASSKYLQLANCESIRPK